MIHYIGDGSVEDIAHMGDDAFISMIAGASHANTTGPGVTKLLEWGHVSPLEFGQIVFRIKLPIFVARQFMRHRAFSYMELSGRYTDMGDQDVFMPCYQDDNSLTLEVIDTLSNHYCSAFEAYQKLLSLGVSKEIARIVLPLATYTEMYVRMDIRHLRDFLALRLDKHAQAEMREYAKAIRDIAMEYFPQCLQDMT